MFRMVTGSGIMDCGTPVPPTPTYDAAFVAGSYAAFTVTGATQTWHWGDGTADDVVASGATIYHDYESPPPHTTTLTLTGGPTTPITMDVDQSGLASFDVSSLTGLTQFRFRYLMTPFNLGPTADFSANVNLTRLVLDNSYYQLVVLPNGGTQMVTLGVAYNRLSSGAVDSLLVALAGGAISGGYTDLSHQTPAAPPGSAGATAVLVLVARGWQVYTD